MTPPRCCLDPAVSRQRSDLVFRGLNVNHSSQKLVHSASLHRAINKRITFHGDSSAEQWVVSVSVRQLMLLVKRFSFNIKVKVKVTLEQATKAQRGSRGIALLFL